MQDLKVVGIEDNALVAVSDEGDRYRVVIDAVMQTKLRQMQSTRQPDRRLSPREIQGLIRAGMSREEVAAATGASVEDVERYEPPVLAEREHVLAGALAVRVHLPEAPDLDTFGALIRVRLSDLNARGERWVAWKDQDRGWMIKLEFTASEIEHDARWTFDQRASSLHPVNADATALSKGGEMKGPLIPRLRAVDTSPASTTEPDQSRFDSGAFTFAEDLADPAEPAAPADTAPTTNTAALPVVLEPVPDATVPFDPIADVTDTMAQPTLEPSSPQAAAAAVNRQAEPVDHQEDTADLLEKLRQRRGEAQPAPEFDPYAPHEDEGTTGPILEAVPEFAPDEAPEPPADTQPIATPDTPGPRRKGRTEIPSWDEIVFGTKSDDEPS